MLLAVKHPILSATMLCFHLHTRYTEEKIVSSGFLIQGEEETVIGSQHAEFMGPTWTVVKESYQWFHLHRVLYMSCHLLLLKLIYFLHSKCVASPRLTGSRQFHSKLSVPMC